MERQVLKVLRTLATYHELTLGDLLEGIVLQAFGGKCAFSQASLQRVKELKKSYGLDLTASSSHCFREAARGSLLN
jgi:hypothetical protein